MKHDFTNYEDFDRQHAKQQKRRVKAARLGFGILLFFCACFAGLIIVIQLHEKELPSHVHTASSFFSQSAGQGNDPDSSAPAEESRQNGAVQRQWPLLLVNKWNPIPEDYDIELTQLDNGQSIDSRIYDALQEMFDAARADGIYPIVAAGYRTAEKQQSIMDEKIQELRAQGYSKADAKKEAKRLVAEPGASEHQLGIAVDINADGIHSTGNEVYQWLANHAYHYGFIQRYPESKVEITGINYEPWHYRYVGIDAAKEIHDQGICLEEYLNSSNRKAA